MFFQVVHELNIARICAVKVYDLSLHRIHISANKQNQC